MKHLGVIGFSYKSAFRFSVIVLLVVFFSGCLQQMSVDDIIESETGFLDREITVGGTVGIERVVCTNAVCPEGNACCNTCSGKLVIRGESGYLEVRGEYNGDPVRCVGTNCAQLCRPMEQGKKYSITGTVEESYGQPYLNLKGFSENP